MANDDVVGSFPGYALSEMVGNPDLWKVRPFNIRASGEVFRILYSKQLLATRESGRFDNWRCDRFLRRISRNIQCELCMLLK